jgi:hypothetical protein
MAEQTPPTPPIFEFDLGDRGDKVRISSYQELSEWNAKEFNFWQWLQNARPASAQTWSEHENFRNQINSHAEQWRQHQSNLQHLPNVMNGIGNVFDNFYCKRRIFHSTVPEAAFIKKIGAERGDAAAAGAYLGLLHAPINLGSPMQADFVAGLFESFLYSREVDWTAAAHQEVLNRLKNQYAGNISHQDTRFKEIETRNDGLNIAFDGALKAKTEALEKLHGEQGVEFKKLIDDHVAKLTAIEKTYDQTLALQKPVKYWQTKERYHRTRSIAYGVVALVAGIFSAGGLGLLAYEYLGKLSNTENPKHWQIGLLVVGAFFAVWLVRVFVRLFFSNVHLATDAAERRMMILTYLAMSREGAQFGPEDKKLIIQHIFRAASDGLVKDDAAPPTLFELLSRK